jgi:hypothetical protein
MYPNKWMCAGRAPAHIHLFGAFRPRLKAWDEGMSKNKN